VPFVGVETDGTIMFSATRDRTIGRSLYTRGWWDAEGLPKALRLAGVGLGEGRLMVEVGANIGTTTIQAAKLGARVLAFEPEPLNYRLLRANVAVNLLDDVVECVQAGCSSTDGTTFMSLSSVNDGEHRVSRAGDLSIAVVRLDSALTARGIDPADVALLWVDAEGHEAEVLAGAPRLLAAKPPIVIEFWPQGLGERWKEFAAAVSAYSTVMDLSTGATTTVERARTRHWDGLTDLLFVDAS
jgi:FkbM family methyltransferase